MFWPLDGLLPVSLSKMLSFLEEGFARALLCPIHCSMERLALRPMQEEIFNILISIVQWEFRII